MRIVVTGISGTKINQSVVPKLQTILANRLGRHAHEIPVIDLEGRLHKLGGKYLEFLNDLPRLSAIDNWSEGALKEFQSKRDDGPAIMCLHATWQVRGHFYFPLTWKYHREKNDAITRLRPLHKILTSFKPDFFLNVIDNCFVTQARLAASCPFRLLEILRWRNVETLHTDLLAELYVDNAKRSTRREQVVHSAMYPYFRSPCLSVRQSMDMVERLLFEDAQPRVYLAYPITKPRKHLLAGDGGAAINEINEFRKALAAKFVAFDPVTIDERPLSVVLTGGDPDGDTVLLTTSKHLWPFDEASIAEMLGNGVLEPEYALSLQEVREVVVEKFSASGTSSRKGGEIDSQIRNRDYRLIDQADGVIMYRPTYKMGEDKHWDRGGTFYEYEYASRFGKTGKPVIIIRDRDEDGPLDHPPFATFYHEDWVVLGRNLSQSTAARMKAFDDAASLFETMNARAIAEREKTSVG